MAADGHDAPHAYKLVLSGIMLFLYRETLLGANRCVQRFVPKRQVVFDISTDDLAGSQAGVSSRHVKTALALDWLSP